MLAATVLTHALIDIDWNIHDAQSHQQPSNSLSDFRQLLVEHITPDAIQQLIKSARLNKPLNNTQLIKMRLTETIITDRQPIIIDSPRNKREREHHDTHHPSEHHDHQDTQEDYTDTNKITQPFYSSPHTFTTQPDILHF